MRVAMSTSSSKSLINSSSEEDGVGELRRGPWTPEEDALLIHYIACHGEGRWNLLAKCSGLRRTGKSCRLRWLNYLKPDVKRGNLTLQEQLQILQLHSKWGNRWSKIAQELPGRTDNEIKNYWRTRVQKQARHLNIDSGSTAFQNMIRCSWMPRLLQKIEGSSLDLTSQNPTTTSPQPPISHSSQHLSTQVFPQRALHTSDDHNGKNSISENSSSSSSSSSFCSSKTVSGSQIPQISEGLISHFQAMPNSNTSDYCTIPRGSYFGENSRYDMEEPFNVGYTSALGDLGTPLGNCQMVDQAWEENDLADCLWNMDES